MTGDRRWLAGLLPVLVAALLSVVLPSLLATDVSTAVGVTLLTLALAALVRLDTGRVLLAAHASVRARVATADQLPPRRRPATDPVHHPLRPRAPGRC